MPSEIEKFQRDLLESVEQMKRGEIARITKIEISKAAQARAQVGLSQQDFAHLLGVSARTLQDWEQGRRKPNGAAKTLLQVAVLHPEVLRELRN
jgi:putative transcriptional regulator